MIKSWVNAVVWIMGVALVLVTVVLPVPGTKLDARPEVSTAAEKKLFMTTGLMIRKIVVVQASVDDAWQAWTTMEGVTAFFAPRASVELAVGGDFEMYFDPKMPEGQRGSEGCKILSFVPGEMLSFTWNAPPHMPAVRLERTWVVLYFQPLEEKKTRISLVHLGWQVGEEWQKALQYFDKAWEVVLGRLQYRFEKGPLDWKNPFTPGGIK
ncbi:MAG: SRPBCC domain-containing protein [Candidatus Aminicenantes bacterium]|nr:SRPBCC domain-containing protein [Candidatus Aminicenantes bacterium]